MGGKRTLAPVSSRHGQLPTGQRRGTFAAIKTSGAGLVASWHSCASGYRDHVGGRGRNTVSDDGADRRCVHLPALHLQIGQGFSWRTMASDWLLDLVGCQYWYLLHAVGRSPNFSRRTYVVRASRRYCRAGCHVGRTNGLLSGRRCASARRASADNTWSRSGHRFLRDPLHASAHRPAHRPFDTALMAGMGRKRTLARAPPIPLSYLELPCLAPVHGTEEPTWTACLKVDEVEEVEEPLFPTGTVNQLRQDRQLRQLWEPVLP